MKLNLGCGGDKRAGWINIDIREEVNPDTVWDLEKTPYPFDDESVDEILAKDVIEHITYLKVEDVLKECFRILKHGGRMYIQCPDMEAIARKVVLSGKYDWKQISYWVYGDQSYGIHGCHKTGFTISTIKHLLESIGFAVESIKNDGGTNLCVWVKKP